MTNQSTFYPQALAQIPIHVVAGIAAQLQSPEAEPTERIRLAYSLLDAAEAARISLVETGSFESGLRMVRFERVKQQRMGEMAKERRADPLVKVGTNGEELPVDFKKATLGLFSKSIKPKTRETKLVEYLANLTNTEDTLRAIFEWAGNPTTREGQKKAIEDWNKTPFFPKPGKDAAEKLLIEWKKNGIPAKDYASLKFNFPRWYEVKKRNDKSAAGKAKQGRVVRKNDKRKGARPKNNFRRLKKIL